MWSANLGVKTDVLTTQRMDSSAMPSTYRRGHWDKCKKSAREQKNTLNVHHNTSHSYAFKYTRCWTRTRTSSARRTPCASSTWAAGAAWW
ncbi:Protein of unknown function [Gryllus bimaculatus]|nr:Protein of unknown function [Gryllus bimaculatus]